MLVNMERKTPTKIVIYGSSGFGREVLWTINDCNKNNTQFDVLGFIDDDSSLWGKKINSIKVIGGKNWFTHENIKTVKCVVAISNPNIRKKIVGELEKKKVQFTTIIHPTVIFSESVKIGNGTIIQAGTIITIDTVLGNHVHVNIDSTIGHDCKIADFVTIAPGSHINGNNKIGSNTDVGSGSVTIQNIKIGKNCIIGASTVIINNIPDCSLVVGNPGKIKDKKKE